MSAVSIAYNLGRHGWSSFRLTVGDSAVDVGKFSYTTDALGDLVRAALLLATSAFSAEVRLDCEPGEWRIILDEGWKSDLRLRVLSLKDYYADLSETEGDVVFQSRLAVDDFARAVHHAAQCIWDEYGAAGYNEAWNGQKGFPLRGLKALEAALSYSDPLPKNDADDPSSASISP